MIKVIVTQKQDIIEKIVIKGHANYDAYGKDIVCAAVSSTFLTTINAILSIDKNTIEYNVDKDVFEVNVINKDVIIQKLLSNMINMLKELSNDYKENITINL